MAVTLVMVVMLQPLLLVVTEMLMLVMCLLLAPAAAGYDAGASATLLSFAATSDAMAASKMA